MGYITYVNEIRDAVFNLIDAAPKIKNLRNFELKLYKRSIPKEIGSDDCPLGSVFKTEVSGGSIETDQPDVELPRDVKITIGLSDFSQVDLDDAEKYTDDLIDKIITRLETNASLSGKCSGIEISRISFDEDRRKGVWFSEPVIELVIKGNSL
jgi:hypothetical protein